MAGLGNTGINGFLSSAKLTGQKIIKRGKEIPEMVEHFLSGFAGYGWKIWEHKKGKYKLEIDDLNVRGTMTVHELLIQKIRAVIGALAITQGQGKIKSVALSSDQSEYLIQVEEDMSFREYDFIRCQTWTGNVKMYHVKISRISDNTIIHIPIEEFDIDYDEFDQLVIHNAPAIGDDIIQFGNEVYKDRQSAIYLHVDESGQPAIDIMFGINSKDWTNCVKGRIGGDIPGGDGAKGMYFENGMIKGTDETGHTVYCIYPNGDAMFGDGSAMFNSDRSGQLAGGAIQWHFNDDKEHFELILGEDVIMSWDNLDNTTKEMLTPKIGENGNWWIGGKDTGQKAEGEDGTSPRIGENGNWWIGTTDTGVKAKGEDANLLDWVNEWNNNRTLIGAEYIVSPKTFSGTRGTDDKLTGVAMGRDCIEIDGVKRTGIFALVDDEIVFELDPITRKYKFKGEIEATEGNLGGMTIAGDTLVSQNGRVVVDGANNAIYLLDENGSTKTVLRPDNIPSISSYFADSFNKTVDTTPITGSYTESYNQKQTVSFNLPTGSFEAIIPEMKLHVYTTSTSELGGGTSLKAELVSPSGVREIGSVGAWASGLSGSDDQSRTFPRRTFPISGSGACYLRIRLQNDSIGEAQATGSGSVSVSSNMVVNGVVNRSEIGNNGMMIATTRTSYNYMVGDTFEIRRGQNILRLNEAGIKINKNGGIGTWNDV